MAENLMPRMPMVMLDTLRMDMVEMATAGASVIWHL